MQVEGAVPTDGEEITEVLPTWSDTSVEPAYEPADSAGTSADVVLNAAPEGAHPPSRLGIASTEAFAEAADAPPLDAPGSEMHPSVFEREPAPERKRAGPGANAPAAKAPVEARPARASRPAPDKPAVVPPAPFALTGAEIAAGPPTLPEVPSVPPASEDIDPVEVRTQTVPDAPAVVGRPMGVVSGTQAQVPGEGGPTARIDLVEDLVSDPAALTLKPEDPVDSPGRPKRRRPVVSLRNFRARPGLSETAADRGRRPMQKTPTVSRSILAVGAVVWGAIACSESPSAHAGPDAGAPLDDASARDRSGPDAAATDSGDTDADAGATNAGAWRISEDWVWHMDAVSAADDTGRNDLDGVSVDPFGFIVAGGPFYAPRAPSGACTAGVSFGGIARCSGVGSDVFVARLRPDGTEAWFVVLDSGQDDDFMFDLTTDSNGDIYVSGQYGGRLATVSGDAVEAERQGSAFVAKLDRDTGEVLWIEAFGGTEAAGGFGAGANEIAVDGLGFVIATITTDNRPESYRIGPWTIDNPDFDAAANPLRAPGKDSFIVKLDPDDGRPRWFFATANDGEPGEHRIRAIGVNGLNQIAFGYQVRGTIRLGDTVYGPQDRASYGAAGVLDPTGQLLWSLDVAATGDPPDETNVRGAGGSISGDIYFTGRLAEAGSGRATVRVRMPNAANEERYTLQTFAGGTAYLLKLSSQGSVQWIRLLGNDDHDAGGELAISDREAIFVTGRNRGPAYAAYAHSLATGQRRLLTPNVHGAPSDNSRATVTRFSSAGDVTGAYAPSTVGFSAGGVLETSPDSSCLALQFGFQGEVTMNNPSLDVLTSTSDADEALTRVCFAPVARSVDLAQHATFSERFMVDGVDFGPTYVYAGGERGTLLCFHGTGGSARSWAVPGSARDRYLRDMADAGYSFVCPSSRDRGAAGRPAQWSAVNTTENPDVVLVDQLLARLALPPPAAGRLFAVGHSNGGGFVSRWAALSSFAASIQAVQYSSAAGIAAIVTASDYRIPSLYTYSRLDTVVQPSRIEANVASLAERDVDHLAVDSTPYHQWRDRDATAPDYHVFWNGAAIALKFFAQY